ncbi:AraC family transcriptional regulator [Thalassospira sp. TSL5-1]|uniref:AraC family transcriptional regulator n=1 Tax=Thalassospira sp. TSL5-1 TaxID=1544451 RepID=UPI00093D2CE9|nr:AraC family transcriptional regulator [Thalassospira sp. TSL5-1]OKH87427.1 AraC family transcriptional regulator [Thalassospira sp. TSL5-1]
MTTLLTSPDTGGIERLCNQTVRERFLTAPALPGIERIEAQFYGDMFAPHRHDTYALGVTLHGVQTFSYRGAKQFSQPGNIIVLHPDETHDGGAGTEAGLRYRMLYLDPALLWRGLGENAPGLPFVAQPVFSDAALSATLLEMLAHLDSDIDELLIDQFVCSVAEGLCRHAKQPIRRSKKLAFPRLARARDFLEANTADTITSTDLEDVTGLDRYTLIRQFKACYATTPHRFLVMRRLQQAKTLIAQGEPLAGIATDTGFADQSHLNRHFKQAFGITPGRWADMIRPQLLTRHDSK